MSYVLCVMQVSVLRP